MAPLTSSYILILCNGLVSYVRLSEASTSVFGAMLNVGLANASVAVNGCFLAGRS